MPVHVSRMTAVMAGIAFFEDGFGFSWAHGFKVQSATLNESDKRDRQRDSAFASWTVAATFLLLCGKNMSEFLPLLQQ